MLLLFWWKFTAHVSESIRSISMKWHPCPFQLVSRRAFKNYHYIRKKKKRVKSSVEDIISHAKWNEKLTSTNSCEISWKCLRGWSRRPLLNREEPPPCGLQNRSGERNHVPPSSPSGLLCRMCRHGLPTPVCYNKYSKDRSRKPEGTTNSGHGIRKVIRGAKLNKIEVYFAHKYCLQVHSVHMW